MAVLSRNLHSWEHPTLKIAKPISSEIFPALCDWIFDLQEFKRWSEESVAWQLYCVGDPGAGKTTLANIVARHLRQQFQSTGHPVVTLFAEEDVVSNELGFLEDFLHAVYHGLVGSPVFDDNPSKEDYQKYTEARFSQNGGLRANIRLSLMRTALHKLLGSRKESFRAFLILDGFDLCNEALLLLLETELVTLRNMGVNVLQTSRIAIFEQNVTKCDHPKHGMTGDPDEDDEPMDEIDRERLNMYYNCDGCLSVLCLDCKADGRVCENDTCESRGPMRERYDYINIAISPPEKPLDDYIRWSLEREHGDIGLRSSASKPPLSAFGLSIRNHKRPGIAQEIVKRIMSLADNHIGFAKARLDFVHELQSVEEWEQRRNQLPANIISILDAAVGAVVKQSISKRRLGLTSIAASSRYDWPYGIPIPVLRQLFNDHSEQDFRSGEDILRAARGLLRFSEGEAIPSAELYSVMLHEYVFNRYNEKLHEAGQEVIFEGQEDVYDMPEPAEEEKARFEPQTIMEEPAEITPSKLHRSVTTVESNHEFVFRAVLRQGTRAWK